MVMLGQFKFNAIISLLWTQYFMHSVFSKQTCGANLAKPLVVPVQNVTSSGITARGITLSIGTPPQALTFIVDEGADNILLQDVADFCAGENESEDYCSASRGIYFNEDISSSWIIASGPSTAGAALQDPAVDASDIFGMDILQLNSSMQLSNFPLGIQRHTDFSWNCLGLGTNSTLLTKLKSVNTIASLTWGLFWGLIGVSQTAEMDGTLTLGGYDAAKTSGPNSTQKFSQAASCQMLVSVTDIKMNFPNQTNLGLLTSDESPLSMCVDPTYAIVTIPDLAWEVFQSNAGGTYIGRAVGLQMWGELYEALGVYAGDLSFTLSTGLTIRIPNNQLVVPNIIDNQDGVPQENSSTREVLLNSLQASNTNDLPLLGITFLSAAYLFVDNERSEFTLWQANPTTEEDLVAVAPLETCTAPSASSTSPVTATASVAAIASSSSSTSTPIGAVAGGVVGGIAILALVACIVACFCYRRRKKENHRLIYPAEKPPFPPESGIASELCSHPVSSELPGITIPEESVIAGRQELETFPNR